MFNWAIGLAILNSPVGLIAIVFSVAFTINAIFWLKSIRDYQIVLESQEKRLKSSGERMQKAMNEWLKWKESNVAIDKEIEKLKFDPEGCGPINDWNRRFNK